MQKNSRIRCCALPTVRLPGQFLEQRQEVTDRLTFFLFPFSLSQISDKNAFLVAEGTFPTFMGYVQSSSTCALQLGPEGAGHQQLSNQTPLDVCCLLASACTAFGGL